MKKMYMKIMAFILGIFGDTVEFNGSRLQGYMMQAYSILFTPNEFRLVKKVVKKYDEIKSMNNGENAFVFITRPENNKGVEEMRVAFNSGYPDNHIADTTNPMYCLSDIVVQVIKCDNYYHGCVKYRDDTYNYNTIGNVVVTY